ELVRMEVQDAEVVEPSTDERRRQEAPVAAAADRDRSPRRDGKLPELRPRRKAEAVGRVGNGADALRDARRVVLARIAAKPELREALVGPRRAARDRACGASVGVRAP